MPTGPSSQAITAWLSKAKKLLDKEHHDAFDMYLNNVTNAWKDTPKKERPSIRNIAAQWGLPVTAATTFSETALLKLSAASAFQIATLAEVTA